MTILQRDVRELASIEGLTALPRLLALVASQPVSVLNYSDLARGVALRSPPHVASGEGLP